jgi:hypothetical protein
MLIGEAQSHLPYGRDRFHEPAVQLLPDELCTRPVQLAPERPL